MHVAPPASSPREWSRGKRAVRLWCVLLISLAGLHVLASIFWSTVLPCFFPWFWAREHRCIAGQPHPWTQRFVAVNGETAAPRHKIAIATVLDNYMSADMRARTIENKRKYAEHWGHTLLAPGPAEVQSLAEGFPTAWAKMRVAEEALKTHDYVFMVDGDAVVMRRDIDLSIAIEEMEAAGVSLLISQDFNSLNSGVFLLKNSTWTHSFLAEARAARPMLATGSFMPLKYENRAFFYLTNMWPQCGGIRRLDAVLAPHHREEEKFREGTLVVDRCLLNRHPMRATEWWRLFDSGAGYDEISDAFIVHCPGGNADSKRMAMDALLSMSEW